MASVFSQLSARTECSHVEIAVREGTGLPTVPKEVSMANAGPAARGPVAVAATIQRRPPSLELALAGAALLAALGGAW